MRRLNEFFSRARDSFDFSLEAWDETVATYLGRYVSTDTLTKFKALLRMELINLARILDAPEFMRLLDWTLIVLRSGLLCDRDGALKYLSARVQAHTKADAAWIALFNSSHQPGSEATLHDWSDHYFLLLDGLLEGCFKPRLQSAAAFMNRLERNTPFPSHDDHPTIGAVVASVPSTFEDGAALYLRDPQFSIRSSQWRNIAAHRSFEVVDEDHVRVRYGMSLPQSEAVVERDQLSHTVRWAIMAVNTLRLADVLFFLDNVSEVSAVAPIRSLSMRIESWLTGLFHNLQLRGFGRVAAVPEGDVFVLRLEDPSARDPAEALATAVLHALTHVAEGLAHDPATKQRYQWVQATIVASDGTVRAAARVDVDAARSAFRGELSIDRFLDAVVPVRSGGQ